MEEEAGFCPDSDEETVEDSKENTMKEQFEDGSEEALQGPSLSSRGQGYEGPAFSLIKHSFLPSRMAA